MTVDACAADRDHVLRLQRGEPYRRVRTVGVREDDGSLTPTDLTGYGYICQVRATREEGSDLLLTASTGNGKIVLGGVAGTITYALDVDDVLDVPAGYYWHDEALIQPSGDPLYVDRGPVVVEPRTSIWTP